MFIEFVQEYITPNCDPQFKLMIVLILHIVTRKIYAYWKGKLHANQKKNKYSSYWLTCLLLDLEMHNVKLRL